jgi:ABC-type antimicrobial peptide transport system permease subunit
MKKSDFQLIGYIGTVLGALFLFGGIFASSYYEVHRGVFGYTYATYPYTQYSGSLLVSGIALLVVGLAFLWRAKQEGAPTQATLPKPPD